ncbi:MAG: DUF1611 domain-containing protein [Calditrichaeota bacterium]|nr:DUF1611 domain-containing protein [Calditrichota bacterium]
MIKGTAIVLTNGWLNNLHAKTCHGLLRGTERFDVLAVVDPVFAGKDAGEIMDGKKRGIPVYANVTEAIEKVGKTPKYAVVGVAVHGGKLPKEMRSELFTAMRKGLSVICGLHSFLSDDPEFIKIAEETGVEMFDVRKPRPISELRFWSGEIYDIKNAVVAVLGTDCALGKRTTARFLTETCRNHGISAEMIYTGQTGWMQGNRYGFVFDSTVNDFISGEIERAIVDCAKEANPDVMFIEGQSALRNPSGPCGTEFLLSGNAKGVILQHAPGRDMFEGHEELGVKIPTLLDEIALIKMYGSRVLGIALNEESWTDAQMRSYQHQQRELLGIPVVRPLVEGVEGLLPAIREYIQTGA